MSVPTSLVSPSLVLSTLCALGSARDGSPDLLSASLSDLAAATGGDSATLRPVLAALSADLHSPLVSLGGDRFGQREWIAGDFFDVFETNEQRFAVCRGGAVVACFDSVDDATERAEQLAGGLGAWVGPTHASGHRRS